MLAKVELPAIQAIRSRPPHRGGTPLLLAGTYRHLSVPEPEEPPPGSVAGLLDAGGEADLPGADDHVARFAAHDRCRQRGHLQS
jgi:hypothetical protein